MKTIRFAYVLPLLLAACGGGSIALQDLDDELAKAECERAVRCGDSPDLDACLASIRVNSDEIAAYEAAQTAGRLEYDGSNAKECLDGLGSLACTYTAAANAEDILQACDDTFIGKVADGGTCFDDEECVSGDCTQPDCMMACCAGTCNPTLAEVAIGSDCSQASCGSDAYCKLDSTAGTAICTARIAEGGACPDFNGCESGTFCSNNTCQRPVNEGETCDPTLFVACNQVEDYCDMTTLKCTAPKPVGTACELSSECVDYAICMGTCVALLRAGETCATDGSGPDCLGDLECVSGTCALPADPNPAPICP